MARNKEIRIKVTKAELSKIKDKSEQLGLPVSSYLRLLGLESKLKIEYED